MAERHSPLVVLGAGPGGYAAAFLAADMGMQVTLVDASPRPGGVCLHRGCIPSKALLHIAKLIDESSHSSAWGVTFEKPKIDLDKVRAFKDGVINKLASGVEGLSKSRGVTLVRGHAVFEASNRIKVATASGPEIITYDHCILATGSRPAMPAAFNLGDDRVMDSTGALELKDIPKKLMVIGGGYIGLEMGTVYHGLGSEVTVVEFADGILPLADRDLVRPLQLRLEKRFKAIHVKTKVAKLEATPAGIVATLEGELAEKIQTFDRVLVSVGRRPNSDGIGLENTKVVVTPKGFVECDKQQRTADPHILVIGDVAGEPGLAHKASREGRIAVEVLAGEPAQFDNHAIPAVVFTDPEIAWAGITESEAKQQGLEVSVGRFPWAASGRAQAIDRTEGLTKVIYDLATERVLGVGIVGPGAGEMIAEGALAIEMGACARDLADTIHAHPTLSETVMESAEVLHGTATHLFRKKK